MLFTISCEGKINFDIKNFDNQKLEYQKIMILPKSSKNRRFLSKIAQNSLLCKFYFLRNVISYRWMVGKFKNRKGIFSPRVPK